MKWHRQKTESAQATAKTAQIPGLGHVEGFSGEYVSEPIPTPVLDDEIEFFVEGYDEDDRPQDFHAAIESFLALDRSSLEAAADSLFANYKAVRERIEAHEDYEDYDEDDAVPAIAGPRDVLDHIEPGFEVTVARDPLSDGEVCVSVICSCDWERTRSLQIVFRQGREVSRVNQA